MNADIKKILEKYGIRHQTTVGYALEQNGSAEREMRMVVEAARTLLVSRNLNKKFWAEAANTAVYALNRTGTSTEKEKTPYELWFNKKPEIANLKTFGSQVYTHILKIKCLKWDAKSRKGIFIGYNENVKGAKVKDIWRWNIFL